MGKTLRLMILLAAGCGGSGNPVVAYDLAMQDPADAIVNGADRSSATTHWIATVNATYSNFQFALFADHTGVYNDEFGTTPTTSITWQKLSSSNIAVSGAMQLPSITAIMGSLANGSFSGNVAGATDSFTISGGTLH
jgi:hypothetical protein